MLATRPSDEIGDFLHFLMALGAEEMVFRRAGAARQAIERFAAVAGLPLPPLYAAYLAEFGVADGGLCIGEDCDARLASLLYYYRAEAADGYLRVPKGGVLIAVRGITGTRALLYDRAVGAEPRVVQSSGGKPGRTEAATFRNHLYGVGFGRARFAADQPAQVLYGEKGATAAMVRAAVELGFEPYWFSDAFQASLERDEVALLVREDRAGAYMHVIAPDERAIADLKAALVHRGAVLA